MHHHHHAHHPAGHAGQHPHQFSHLYQPGVPGVNPHQFYPHMQPPPPPVPVPVPVPPQQSAGEELRKGDRVEGQLPRGVDGRMVWLRGTVVQIQDDTYAVEFDSLQDPQVIRKSDVRFIDRPPPSAPTPNSSGTPAGPLTSPAPIGAGQGVGPATPGTGIHPPPTGHPPSGQVSASSHPSSKGETPAWPAYGGAQAPPGFPGTPQAVGTPSPNMPTPGMPPSMPGGGIPGAPPGEEDDKWTEQIDALKLNFRKSLERMRTALNHGKGPAGALDSNTSDSGAPADGGE
eukprot:Hpha_TRINITY_DN15710_c4_g1::TRINITY_DN15710_c4_g1_i2::g.41697::m.41697